MKDFVLLGGMVTLLAGAILTMTTDLPQAALAMLTDTKQQCLQALREGGVQFKEHEAVVTSTRLNEDGIKDHVVRLQDEDNCGSGGCSYELCLGRSGGGARHIDFGYAAHEFSTLPALSNDMHDIILNNEASLRLSWNGTRYELER